MRLFIMRHGDADQFGLSDSERSLTEQGHLEASVMAKWLTQESVDFEHVLVSPYVRAQQTAKTLLAGMSVAPSITTLDNLIPSGSCQQVHDYIDGICSLEKINNLLIVSHMPLVSYLVSELTIEHNAPIFQTAAIAEIDYDLKRMKGHFGRITAPADLC